MSKNLEISVLCDIYGALLPEKQRDAIDLYYNEDLSLAEIAEQVGISRQGVRDQIKHGENQLLELEKALNLHKKSVMTEKILTELEKQTQICSNSKVIAELVKSLRSINE